MQPSPPQNSGGKVSWRCRPCDRGFSKALIDAWTLARTSVEDLDFAVGRGFQRIAGLGAEGDPGGLGGVVVVPAAHRAAHRGAADVADDLAHPAADADLDVDV